MTHVGVFSRVIGTAIVIVFASHINGCEKSYQKGDLRNLSVAEIKKHIARKLSIGQSKKKDAIQFLATNNIDYTVQPDFASKPRGLEDAERISAEIPQKSMIHRNYKVIINFYFNKTDDTLLELNVAASYPTL